MNIAERQSEYEAAGWEVTLATEMPSREFNRRSGVGADTPVDHIASGPALMGRLAAAGRLLLLKIEEHTGVDIDPYHAMGTGVLEAWRVAWGQTMQPPRLEAVANPMYPVRTAVTVVPFRPEHAQQWLNAPGSARLLGGFALPGRVRPPLTYVSFVDIREGEATIGVGITGGSELQFVHVIPQPPDAPFAARHSRHS